MSLSGAVVNPQLVPAYIQRLGKENVMQGKTFSTLQMQQPNWMRVPHPARLMFLQRRYVEFTMYSSPDSEAKK